MLVLDAAAQAELPQCRVGLTVPTYTSCRMLLLAPQDVPAKVIMIASCLVALASVSLRCEFQVSPLTSVTPTYFDLSSSSSSRQFIFSLTASTRSAGEQHVLTILTILVFISAFQTNTRLATLTSVSCILWLVVAGYSAPFQEAKSLA